MAKRVLLHICCGVCALSCIERLKREGFCVEGLFFNPNIHPQSEYTRRIKELDKVRGIFGVKITEGKYTPRAWFDLCRYYAQEKEGGRRCLICYRMRLEETFKVCKEEGFDFFTTTLTVSPHKRSRDIFEVGYEVGGDCFLDIDFKKKDGFRRSCELSREHGFYHQNYCGCVYSLLERKKTEGFSSGQGVKIKTRGV